MGERVVKQTLVVDLPSVLPVPTVAERAAAVIRDGIFEGRFHPGTPLPESALAKALGVSRNTVREAFRTLMGEQLLTYEPHRGVAVRSLHAEDVQDIYRLRRMHELAAIDLLREGATTVDESRLRASVEAGRAAGFRADWGLVGTANLQFHADIVALHGSSRLDDFFRRLMTEMRLGFLALPDAEAFHAPYVERNSQLCDDLIAGRFTEAQTALWTYLDDAMTEVVAAVSP
jgi:DNA-binding GntR family transcriptional regulator